jgi:hypothetical protein
VSFWGHVKEALGGHSGVTEAEAEAAQQRADRKAHEQALVAGGIKRRAHVVLSNPKPRKRCSPELLRVYERALED